MRINVILLQNKTCSVPSHCVVGDASYQEDYCYVTAGGFDDYKNTCCLEDHDAGVSSEQGNFYCFCCSAPCDKEGNCYRYTTKKEIVGDKDFDELELEVIERRKVINRKQYM